MMPTVFMTPKVLTGGHFDERHTPWGVFVARVRERRASQTSRLRECRWIGPVSIMGNEHEQRDDAGRPA